MAGNVIGVTDPNDSGRSGSSGRAGSPYQAYINSNPFTQFQNSGPLAPYQPGALMQQLNSQTGGFTPSNPNSPFIDNMQSPSNNFVSPLLGQQTGGGISSDPSYSNGYNGPSVSDVTNNTPSLYDSLLQQLLGGTGGMPSTADLQSQAQQQAALKYDPLIQQLQQNLGTAKSNEGVASQKIGDLYGSLGRALAAQMPVITNQFNAAENQSQQNYQTLQNQIQGNYQNAQAQQAAELQRLGIQAALPQSTEKLGRDQQYLTGQAQANGQALNDAMRLMGQGQSDFAQRASMIAPTQGANIQSDLAQKLLQLENTTGQQIAGYKGQEAADAANLLAQLQSAAATNQQKQQDSLNTNIVSLLNNMTTNQTRMNIAGGKSQNYKGINDAASWLQQNAPQDAAQLEGILNTFQNDPQTAQITGPGGIGSPTYFTLLQALMKNPQAKALSPSQQQELQNGLAIMEGKF